jgi:hypothetical protein
VALRLVSPIAALALAAATAGSSGAGGAVVVDEIGFGQAATTVGSAYSFGVVLLNRSTTRDAVGVTVGVTVYGPKRVGVLYGHDFSIGVIPAAQRFVVGDGGANLGVPITRVRATVRIRAMQPHHRALPPISAIRIDRRDSGVTAEIQNPYTTAIDLFRASAYAVVFDRRGRVIGGGSSSPLAAAVGGPAKLAPGGYLPVAVRISGVPMAKVVRAEVSINP